MRIEYRAIIQGTGLPLTDTDAEVNVFIMDIASGKYWNGTLGTWQDLGISNPMTLVGNLWVYELESAEDGKLYRVIAGDSESICYPLDAVILESSTLLYISYADVEDEIDALEEYIPEGRDATAYVNGKIRAAQRVVDGALRKVYSTPFASPVPELIKDITLHLAVFRVMRPPNVKEEVPEFVMKYQSDAMDLLKQLADGEMTLDDTAEKGMPISTTKDIDRDFKRTKRDKSGGIIQTGTFSDPGNGFRW
jgi:hypothetical protein